MKHPKLAPLFKGKETVAEEKKEARAVKSGKISIKDYVKGEKSEGDKAPAKKLAQKAKDMKSGKMSAAQYASKAKK
jgi:hypothetical protein